MLKEVRPKGVIFEGWEPTQDENSKEIVETIKEEIGSSTLLLTNGYLFPPLNFDEIKISIKAYSESIHRDYTNESNRNVLFNFRRIYDSKSTKLSAETVLIPGYVDIQEMEASQSL